MSGVHFRPYPTRAVVPPSTAAPLHPPQTLASGGSPTEVILPRAFAYVAGPHNHQTTQFRGTQWRGSMTNQHPRLYSFVGPTTARPRSTQALSHHHMHVRSGVGQAFAYQGTRGGTSRAQITVNPHHRAHHDVYPMPVNPPHSGGPHSLHPGCNTPMANMPDSQRQFLAVFNGAQDSRLGHQGITGWQPQVTQSLGACALQSSSQAAIPPQQSPPLAKQDLSKLSTSTAQPSQPPFVVSFEDASSANSSSAREETGLGSKDAPSATTTCPLPKCKLRCGRLQELERHLRELHLPHDIYCQELGCDWTGNRRYALQSHLARKHLLIDVPMPGQEAFTIYDSKSLAKRLVNEEISVEQAVHESCSLFEEKARSVGKQGLWRRMRGL